MQINKANLLTALEATKPGLSNKEIIDQATSFAFIKGKVVTYNDEISISHPVEGLDIEGAVKADQLYQLLAKIKKEEIDIEIVGEELIVKAGKAKAGLTLQAEITLPLDSLGKKGKWKSLPDNFCERLKFTLFSAGKDMSHPMMTCAHINQEGWIETSDGFRVTKYKIDPMPIPTFLIPAVSCAIIADMQPIKIAEGSGWVHFKTAEGAVLSCRIFEGDKYPDTAAILAMKGKELTLPKNIGAVIDRSNPFSKRAHALEEFLDITIKEGALIIHADSDTGWFEEEVKMEYVGKEIKFSISPYVLKSIIKQTLLCSIADNRMKFQGDGWEYVTALRATK